MCVFICVKEHKIETHFVLLQKVMLKVDFNEITTLVGLSAAEFTYVMRARMCLRIE